MTDYTELVNALRRCDMKQGCYNANCKYSIGKYFCDMNKVHADAAAAIEALQANVKRLEQERDELIGQMPEMTETADGWKWKWKPHWVSVEDDLPSEFQSVWAACKMGGRENWTIETTYDPYLSCPWGHIPVLDSGKAIVYAWMDRTEPEPPQEV